MFQDHDLDQVESSDTDGFLQHELPQEALEYDQERRPRRAELLAGLLHLFELDRRTSSIHCVLASYLHLANKPHSLANVFLSHRALIRGISNASVPSFRVRTTQSSFVPIVVRPPTSRPKWKTPKTGKS